MFDDSDHETFRVFYENSRRECVHWFYSRIVLGPFRGHYEESCAALWMSNVMKFSLFALLQNIIDSSWYIVVADFMLWERPKLSSIVSIAKWI